MTAINNQQPRTDWHVCGLVVQCRIQKINEIQTALLAIEGTEIPGADADKGKLVVVMQSHDQQILLENMERARNIKGVIAVSLVYHEQDELSARPEQEPKN
ncbi:periplasmic nitrate reductase chaperone NapD [Mesocricetibacter intestinalis]|uniref:Chaperone NapD n=1 Tax=Mesocricetibacter intestinalis TaxID=1521930 RepID=A0A4R6VAB5_9PAST|nr:chaperone NapD [Mesocricetibacter intestinalis]TDQ56658.1 periplasmic nitrate reductase chaperone NapD [Mesocricetibacter intestinalis]